MSMKVKFALLVAGIIIVPFFVTAAVFSFHAADTAKTEPVPNYFKTTSWIRNKIPQLIKNGDFDELLHTKPAGLDAVVLDGTNTILASSIQTMETGERISSEQLLEFLKKEHESFEVLLQNTVDASGKGLLLLRFPREQESSRREFKIRQLELVTYFSSSLLLFSFLMSFFIARSINKSISTLEKATRRIAEGDLDFELPLKGKDEFASLTRSFDSMRKSLKEEYARRARFIMGVSHDLRTPLTLIEGYVEAIADGYADKPEILGKYTGIILQKSKALGDMITDLMEFARMETGEWKLTHKQTDMHEFLLDICRRFHEDAALVRRSFTCSVDIPPRCMVSMDGKMILRVFENLLGNAIRYTEQNGSIHLRANMKDGEIRISIRDTGIGIAPEDMSRIFNPFYRGTNSRREHGFGLGLSTVKSIIDAHGWAIEAESEPGKGAVFTIRIPDGTGR